MAFCINCGAHNNDTSAFCLQCGHRLYHEAEIPPLVGSKRRFPTAAAVSLALVCLAVIGTVIRAGVHRPKQESVTPSVEPASQSGRKSLPVNAVLTIVARHADGEPFAQGSGFLLTPDGLAASNYHVLDGAALATAECCNNRTFEVRTIEGVDAKKDLVVFQLFERGASRKPDGLPYVTLQATGQMEAGARVIAIGSPQGLENTISDGILSAIREQKGIRYLQITAPISPGSSGGPILNESGEVVGVATFQLDRGQNLNFAIAADYLRPLINQHNQIALAQFNWSNQRPTDFNAASDAPATGEEAQSLRAGALTGSFSGMVHNKTGGQSAEFGVSIRDDNGTLVGCMGVKRPLFGSGPLTGIAYGRTISFKVDSAIGQMVFSGRTDGPAIDGEYQVVNQNSPQESGTFTLRKVNSDGPKRDFELSKCPTDAGGD
jgi:S1-C subfamily serine protease